MSLRSSLLGGAAFLAASTFLPAEPPATNSPPRPTEPPAATNVQPSTPAPAAPKPAASVFDDYLGDLNDTLKLTADEKREIQSYYLADGPALKNILTSPLLSPLEQAKQVADLRDKRDAKIDVLLEDINRQHEFAEVEAKYRVALTEFAANGGLASAQPPAEAPAPAATTPAPAAR